MLLNHKVDQFLGLATKAGKLSSGEELVVKGIANKQIYLAILAEDASENTKKKLRDKCKSYGVPLRFYASRDHIGHCIGKAQRVVIGLNDQGFARQLIKHIDNKEGGHI